MTLEEQIGLRNMTRANLKNAYYWVVVATKPAED